MLMRLHFLSALLALTPLCLVLGADDLAGEDYRVTVSPKPYLPAIGPNDLRYDKPKLHFDRTQLTPLGESELHAMRTLGVEEEAAIEAPESIDFSMRRQSAEMPGPQTIEDGGDDAIMRVGTLPEFTFLDDDSTGNQKDTIDADDFYLFLKEDIPVSGTTRDVQATLPFKVPAQSGGSTPFVPSSASYTRQP